MDVRDEAVRFSTPVDALAAIPNQRSLSRGTALGVAAEPLPGTLEYFLTECGMTGL